MSAPGIAAEGAAWWRRAACGAARRVSDRARRAGGAGVVAMGLLVGMAYAASMPLIADERFHVAQIRRFLAGRWELEPLLTTIPGYHLIVAALVRPVSADGGLVALRLCSFALSLAGLLTIGMLARTAGDGRSTERVAQVALLPILFPLWFLVYTDAAALLFLALALLLQEHERPWCAAMAGVAALAVRQNHVVWIGYAMALLLIAVHARPVTPAGSRARSPRWRTALVAGQRAMGYLLVLALFASFTAWNHGVALGDVAMHPFPTVHLGNIYFAAFVGFVLLLPVHAANAAAIAALLRRRRVVVAPTVVLALGVFLSTFTLDHPYNQPAMDWWLHNRALVALASSVPAKVLMFAAMCVTVLSFCVMPFCRPSQYLVYPFAALSLLPAWQIEQRYYLPFFVFLLLARVQRSVAFEWSLIAYLAALTTICFGGVVAGDFFL